MRKVMLSRLKRKRSAEHNHLFVRFGDHILRPTLVWHVEAHNEHCLVHYKVPRPDGGLKVMELRVHAPLESFHQQLNKGARTFMMGEEPWVYQPIVLGPHLFEPSDVIYAVAQGEQTMARCSLGSLSQPLDILIPQPVDVVAIALRAPDAAQQTNPKPFLEAVQAAVEAYAAHDLPAALDHVERLMRGQTPLQLFGLLLARLQLDPLADLGPAVRSYLKDLRADPSFLPLLAQGPQQWMTQELTVGQAAEALSRMLDEGADPSANFLQAFATLRDEPTRIIPAES